jgi:hypothetical protein
MKAQESILSLYTTNEQFHLQYYQKRINRNKFNQGSKMLTLRTTK